MLKPFLALAASALLFGSCAPASENVVNMDVGIVYHGNHQYLVFCNRAVQAVIHDPDCGCQDKYTAWIEHRCNGEDLIHIQRRRPSDYD